MALHGARLIAQPKAAREPPDQDLVARVVAVNDTRAFGELVRRHQSQVRNFLRRLSRDDAVADDLAQDAFLHAWDKLTTYSARGSFIGWLLRIAYTTFLQSRRGAKRYSEILRAAGDVAGAESRRYTDAHDEAPDIDRLLAVLTEEERAIFVMAYACGLSHREIANAMLMPIGTVKSVIHRGKQKIRTQFDIKDVQHG